MTLIALCVAALACLIALREQRAARLAALICMLSAGATGAVSAQTSGTILRPLLQDQWNGWDNLGALTIGRPECLATQPNRLDCFTQVNGGMLTREQWDGQRWIGPTLLGGIAATADFPWARGDCVTWEADHIDCVLPGADTNADGKANVFRRTMHGGFVTGWEALGGEITTNPECVAVRVGRLECFARGANGQLLQNSFDGDIWSGWIARGGQLSPNFDISCAVLRGEISCVVVTAQSMLQQMRFTATGVTTLNMQGGDVIGSPKCYLMTGANSADFDDQIVCVAPRLTLLGRWIWGGAGNWAVSDMGGPITGADWDCVTRGGERLDCIELVPTVDSFTHTPVAVKLRHRTLQAGLGVTQLGDLLTLQDGRPTFLRCVSWAPDRIDCFVGGGNAPLSHSWLAPAPARPRFRPNP